MNLEWASEWTHEWSFFTEAFLRSKPVPGMLRNIFYFNFHTVFWRIITFTLVANNLTVKADTGLSREDTKALLEQPSWSLTDSSFIPELVADVRYEGKVWKTEDSALMQRAQKWETMMSSSDTTAVSVRDHTIKQEIRTQEGNFSSCPESWQRLRGNTRFWTHRGFLVCADLVWWGLDRQRKMEASIKHKV